MSYNYCKLYPIDPNLYLENEAALCEVLRELGLIADEFEWHGQKRYKFGSQFFNLFDNVQGTVKSVYVSDASSYSTRIIKTEASRPIVLDGGMETKAPSCPNCAYSHAEFGGLISQWWENPSEFLWKCPNCIHQYPIHQLNWHYTMGFAQYAIEIFNIGWHQVKPSKKLLETLKTFAGLEFSYIYGRL